MAIEMINDVNICNEFKHFENKTQGVYPVDNWEITYDFQKTQSNFPFSDSKFVNILIWEASGYFVREQKKYDGMFAYAEIIDIAGGQIWYSSFFGETAGEDAFRWATDKANKELN